VTLQKSCVVRQLPRRSSKQSNCPEKVHRDVTAAQLLTHVADSLRYVQHIINPLQRRVKHLKTIQIKDSMKLINEFQHMKSGSTKASDQCLPIGRKSDREPKLPGLTICSWASDDTTNVTRVRGPIATAAHEVGHNPNQESRSSMLLLRL
jgi:hypothetical protein